MKKCKLGYEKQDRQSRPVTLPICLYFSLRYKYTKSIL